MARQRVERGVKGRQKAEIPPLRQRQLDAPHQPDEQEHHRRGDPGEAVEAAF
jgi:hypothetical protein